MTWHITIHRQALKRVQKMPKREQAKLDLLIRDLRLRGPVLADWANYSKLSANQHHCHLSYKWVACWVVTDEGQCELEIYYVGSREDAPY